MLIKKGAYLSVSILDANLLELSNVLPVLEQSTAVKYCHLDVMDGHFVPNLTIGPKIARDLRSYSSIPLDAHLMVTNPDGLIDPFINAGVEALTVHVEACFHLHRTIDRIKKQGVLAGVALNPATPIYLLEEIIPCIDLILVMSVNPGFGGQSFIRSTLDKIKRLKHLLKQKGREEVIISVDGGIKLHNAQAIIEHGANLLITGSAIFSNEKGVQEGLSKFESLLTPSYSS